MLDTDTCSYILRKRPPSVHKRFKRVGFPNLCISTVVLAELYYGAARHPLGARIREEIDDFASRLKIFPWDEKAADHYGEVRAHLEQGGSPIGAMDMMIAAHARSLNAVLVTNNTAHFSRVAGLSTENWT